MATANGGQHHYYCTSTLLGSRNNLLEGVDLKGDGGYVVGPGSMIDGRSYTVIDDRPLAVLPEWFPAGLQDTRGQRCRSTMRQPRTVATREPTYTVPEISAELEVIDPNSGYDDWRDIIWCVRAIWGNTQNVLDACNDWSQQSHKYKAGDVEKVWESFDSEAFTADPHKRLGELKQKCLVLHAYLPSVPEADRSLADELEHHAAKRALDFMERNNGPLSPAHKTAIKFIAKALARSGLTEEPSRIVLPLFTGGGKTTTVAAYLCALQEHSDRGAWVATGTIEQQRELAKTLQEEFKVPVDKIGIWNSKEKFSRENAQDFQLMLVTHQRVRTNQLSYLMTYKDKPRQLIWDESLIATTPQSVPILDLMKRIGDWRAYYRAVRAGHAEGPTLTQVHHAASEYLSAVEAIMDNATPGSKVEFPAWSSGDLDSALELSNSNGNLQILSDLPSRTVYVKRIGTYNTVLSFVVEI
ncbi:MAG: bifunctional DNA primase/polymerase, partial [Gammaproteobacteria bacterium]